MSSVFHFFLLHTGVQNTEIFSPKVSLVEQHKAMRVVVVVKLLPALTLCLTCIEVYICSKLTFSASI